MFKYNYNRNIRNKKHVFAELDLFLGFMHKVNEKKKHIREQAQIIKERRKKDGKV